MPIKKADRITYLTDSNVERAFLFNCRLLDLVDGPGIKRGDIVKGKHGYVVAECDVPKVIGTIAEFKPNGRCAWKGKPLDCLFLPGKPRKDSKLQCMNYVVARVPDALTISALNSAGVTVVETTSGLSLVTLECDRFGKQSSERCARMVEYCTQNLKPEKN